MNKNLQSQQNYFTMKTNNPKHPVFAYLMNCINEEYCNGTDSEKVAQAVEIFKNEMQYTIKNGYGIHKALQEWFSGLCSAVNVDFYNYRIIELAKEWGSIPQDATEKQEDKILLNWWPFIATKFMQLAKQHKVNF